MPDYRPALDTALAAAGEARQIILAECARPEGPRGEIGHCPCDDEAELIIRQRLLAAFPTWGYLGEETDHKAPDGDETHIWLVDPNDGTQAMQQGFRGHAVSIGLLRDRVPVLGVIWAVDAPDDDGDLFAWAEGCGPLTRNGQAVEREPWPDRLRSQDVVVVSQSADLHPAGNVPLVAPARYRSAASIAYRLALVAVGEGVAGVGLSGAVAWDYGGGHALLRAVGGTLVDQTGSEVTYASNGWSSTRWCFGGAPGLLRDLSQRDWRGAFGSGFGDAAPPPGLEPAILRPGHLVHDTAVLRRAHGCLLGQLAGDALGALVEFQSDAAIARQYPDGGPRLMAAGGPHRISAGQPTDDSELALVLARTLVQQGGYDREAVALGYARWLNGWAHELKARHRWCRPFDVGNTIRTALGTIDLEQIQAGIAAATAEVAANTSSQANGALMRISPLAIWGWRRDEQELANLARADARLTHPHPVCQEASATYVVALARAIRDGGTPRAVYDHALRWATANCSEPAVLQALERAAAEPPLDYLTQQGWVLIALQDTFYRLLHEPSLEAAVVATVRQGGDTDTNAAICGALVGAVHGRQAIPAQWQRMILSCRPLVGAPGIQQPRPALFWPADALALAERLLLAGAPAATA